MKKSNATRYIAILTLAIVLAASTLMVMAAAALGTAKNYAVNASTKTYQNKTFADKWDVNSEKQCTFESKVTSGSKVKFELYRWGGLIDVCYWRSDSGVSEYKVTGILPVDDYYYKATWLSGEQSSGWGKLS